MGDRVSIQFKNGSEKSVVLFAHWGGIGFVGYAKEYVKKLCKEIENRECTPIERLEPSIVMVDFIRYLFSDEPDKTVDSSYYLGIDKHDGDNSDNGHHVINLKKIRMGMEN